MTLGPLQSVNSRMHPFVFMLATADMFQTRFCFNILILQAWKLFFYNLLDLEYLNLYVLDLSINDCRFDSFFFNSKCLCYMIIKFLNVWYNNIENCL